MNDYTQEVVVFFVCVSLAYMFAGLLTTGIMLDYFRCCEPSSVVMGIVWPLTAIVILPYVVTRWFINLRIWDSHTDPDGET